MQVFGIIFLAIITLCLVYAHQPLSPLLSEYFDAQIQTITLITSLTLLPLAIAPIFYGYLAEIFSARKIIVISSVICAILQALSTTCTTISTFLVIRAIQAMFFPAILTTLLTTLSRISSGNIQRNISIYVSATIAGGLIGRVLGSFFADLFGWQICFNIFAFIMLCVGLFFLKLPDCAPISRHNQSLKAFLPFLSSSRIRRILLSTACMMFAFQTILTILPFHLKDLDSNISQSRIGLFYVSYLVGIFVSLFAQKATRIANGKVNLIIFGFVIFALGAAVMMFARINIIFVGMFVVCAGCFICHNLLSALLNSISTHQKGIANGLYLSFYYTGGALGSYLPIFCFKTAGWNALCVGLFVLLGINAILFYAYRARFSRF